MHEPRRYLELVTSRSACLLAPLIALLSPLVPGAEAAQLIARSDVTTLTSDREYVLYTNRDKSNSVVRDLMTVDGITDVYELPESLEVTKDMALQAPSLHDVKNSFSTKTTKMLLRTIIIRCDSCEASRLQILARKSLAKDIIGGEPSLLFMGNRHDSLTSAPTTAPSSTSTAAPVLFASGLDPIGEPTAVGQGGQNTIVAIIDTGLWLHRRLNPILERVTCTAGGCAPSAPGTTSEVYDPGAPNTGPARFSDVGGLSVQQAGTQGFVTRWRVANVAGVWEIYAQRTGDVAPIRMTGHYGAGMVVNVNDRRFTPGAAGGCARCPSFEIKGAVNPGYNAGDDFEFFTRMGDDEVGHGTHMAGLISEVAPQTQLVSIKPFNSDGVATFGEIRQALLWALRHAPGNDDNLKRLIVNMSWGVRADSTFTAQLNQLQTELQNGVAQNVVWVTSAGNTGEAVAHCQGANIQDGAYPAAFSDEVITVSGTEWAGAGRSAYLKGWYSDSNSGNPWQVNGPCPGNTSVAIAAPATRIPSAWPGRRPTNEAPLSGTSVAAAQVSGAVARIMNTLWIPGNPPPTLAQIKAQLKTQYSEVLASVYRRSSTVSRMRGRQIGNYRLHLGEAQAGGGAPIAAAVYCDVRVRWRTGPVAPNGRWDIDELVPGTGWVNRAQIAGLTGSTGAVALANGQLTVSSFQIAFRGLHGPLPAPPPPALPAHPQQGSMFYVAFGGHGHGEMKDVTQLSLR